MSTAARKKSPRAPSISLDDAIEKATKIYGLERCHAAPVDGVAQHLGYKNGSNGAALSTLASLKYYGLLERPKDGMLCVSKDVESFQFAPSETLKRGLITKWLKSPPVFTEMLDKYSEGLPSDGTLKFDLIQMGFTPPAADLCLQVFRRSVEYAHYFEQVQTTPSDTQLKVDVGISSEPTEEPSRITGAVSHTALASPPIQQTSPIAVDTDVDRIPVRLSGGRRAWIEVPMPFYEADKERLKKQIDLLLTNDDEGPEDLI